MKRTPTLDVRKVPRQLRAKQTVDAIFEAAAHLIELLGDFCAPDKRELRVMMAMGAVEGAYTGMRAEADGGPAFLQQRGDIVRMVLNILSK